MNRYAAAKPYTLPTALAELDGPTTGTVTLPRHLDRDPDRSTTRPTRLMSC
ncbi:hypothetical protein [Streptomyces sp. NPDC058371]|uniref:hypothetical protein n=1 Tax=Streptomyces sp. NPDC058371 TaxID=3346463 RepID=UPI00365ED67F